MQNLINLVSSNNFMSNFIRFFRLVIVFQCIQLINISNILDNIRIIILKALLILIFYQIINILLKECDFHDNLYLFQIWQFPHQTFLQLSMYFILDLVRLYCTCAVKDYLNALAPTTRLFLISLIYLWGIRTCQKLITVIMFSYSSITDFKQRKPINFFLLGKNFCEFCL